MLPRRSAILSVLRRSKEMPSPVRPAPTRLPRRGLNVKNLWLPYRFKSLMKHFVVSPKAVPMLPTAIDVSRNPLLVVFCRASVPSSAARLIHRPIHGTREIM